MVVHFVDGGGWRCICLGWWWVAVDGDEWWWVMVSGGGWWWTYFGWWWLVLDGSGWWWLVA